jgi:AraC-like DNA-binding protein
MTSKTSTPRLAMEAKTEALETAVIEAYLETGEGLCVKQIAARLGWSESTVRGVIDHHHGITPRLRCYQDARTSYSKDYPGMSAGVHKVWAYIPGRDTLRQMVLDLRKKVSS